jgi:hypothetical protein
MQKSDVVTTTSLETEQSREILVPRHCTLAGFTEVTSQQKGLHVGSLAPVTRLAVRTRNTVYKITVVEPKDWKVLVQGGRFFPTERFAFLCGSGYGGTLLKVAWIGVGLCCELSTEGQRVVTSPVQDFRVLTNALPGPF